MNEGILRFQKMRHWKTFALFISVVDLSYSSSVQDTENQYSRSTSQDLENPTEFTEIVPTRYGHSIDVGVDTVENQSESGERFLLKFTRNDIYELDQE